MSSQVDFLANHFPRQGREGGQTMTAISGARCSAALTKSDRLGSLVRMLLESPRWFSPARRLMWEVRPICSERVTTFKSQGESLSLKKSAEILSQLDIPSNRLLFQLVPYPHHTEETESSSLHTMLLQTPRVVQTYEEPEKFLARKERNGYRNGTMYSSLESQVKFDPKFKGLLKTPAAIDAMITSPKANPTSGNSGTLAQEMMCGFVEKRGFILPTPVARDWKGEEGRSLQRRKEGEKPMDTLPGALKSVCESSSSEGGKNSRLNPLFVEEMMGFPLMWTACPFLSESGEPKP